MKVYIQQYKKEFLDDWLFAANSGFRSLNADIQYFEDINQVPVQTDNVIVAYVEDTIDYFNKAGIAIPDSLNLPFELLSDSLLGRKVEFLTLGEFDKIETRPIFVKPDGQAKLFSSGVIKSRNSGIHLFHNLSKDTKVMTSEIVDMVSEYRCFVYKAKLVGIKHYQGDFTIFPSMDVINDGISKYKSAPVAYTIDFGIILTESGPKTILIECNDFWSIGYYGLNEILYAQMLRDRWFEIVR